MKRENKRYRIDNKIAALLGHVDVPDNTLRSVVGGSVSTRVWNAVGNNVAGGVSRRIDPTINFVEQTLRDR